MARLFQGRKIVLIPKNEGLKFCGPSTLNQFEILKVDFTMRKNNHQMIIKILIKRLLGQHLLATFFPTICIMIISCMTLVIDMAHFEASIMVALTAMLVMHTLYQSTADVLPTTGYIKLIDIWLIFGLVLPFVVFTSLIMIRVIPNLRMVEKKLNSPKIQAMVQNTLMVGLMVITAMFIIFYFIFAFNQYWGETGGLQKSGCTK